MMLKNVLKIFLIISGFLNVTFFMAGFNKGGFNLISDRSLRFQKKENFATRIENYIEFANIFLSIFYLFSIYFITKDNNYS